MTEKIKFILGRVETFWEKQKMLITCQGTVFATCKYQHSAAVKFIKTHYHTIPHFDARNIYSCGKHCEKRNKQFLLSSQCFLPCMVLISNFKCTLKGHLQFVSIWSSLKFCHLEMGTQSAFH